MGNGCFVRSVHSFIDRVWCRVQRKKKLEHPLAAYLIKPVQRITKYQLLLKDLQACCAEGQGEIKVSTYLRTSYIYVYAAECRYDSATFSIKLIPDPAVEFMFI